MEWEDKWVECPTLVPLVRINPITFSLSLAQQQAAPGAGVQQPNFANLFAGRFTPFFETKGR